MSRESWWPEQIDKPAAWTLAKLVVAPFAFVAWYGLPALAALALVRVALYWVLS